MIQHSKPTLGKPEIRALARVVRSGEIAGGQEVEKFETEIARYVGVTDACAVNSGTAALHLALLALGAEKGREVIIPSYICSAVLNAVNYTGARPVLADVEPDTGNISIASVRALVSRRTVAIVVAHMFGLPADIEAVLNLGPPVVEDCAMAIGAVHASRKATAGGQPLQRKVGAWGTIAVASFYATKIMATGQGGVVLSSDRRLMRRIRDYVHYDNRENYIVRYNYPMSALQAALGRVQLSQLDGFVQKRRAIAEEYIVKLAGLPVGLPVFARNASEHVYFRFVLQLEKGLSELLRHARARGVEMKRPVFKPLHRYLGLAKSAFKGAEKIFAGAASIPIYPRLTGAEIGKIALVIRDFFRDGR